MKPLAVLIAIILMVAACTPDPTASPSTNDANASSAAVPGTAGPSAAVPSSAPDPGATATPGDPGTGLDPGRLDRVVTLPEPLLADPFDIGDALYDPARVEVGVVSLLALMGIGIYARDGTPIRAGAEHGAGDPWMFDLEVRDLIDRSSEELTVSMGEDGDGTLPIGMDDLYADLSPLVPGLDARGFTRAYADAYADHPNDLVPQVLLGQPIDASFRMTSAQAWLLLLDGFVGPADQATGAIVPGAHVAAAPIGPSWGTAQASLPPPPLAAGSMTLDERQELIAHLPTLPSLIGFDVVQGAIHEGHGAEGDPGRVVAWVGPSVPVVSPTTGRRLLEQVNGDMGATAGLEVRWQTLDPATLQRHGRLDRSLPAAMPFDAGGEATVTYLPRREPADGVGFAADDFASLYATVDGRQLIDAFYRTGDPMVQVLLHSIPNLRGKVTSSTRGFDIGFHALGLQLTLINEYDVTTGVGIGMDARAHRNGTERAAGLLTRYADDTYRGMMVGHIDTTTDLTLALPLAGGECHAPTNTTQRLWVVGVQAPGGSLLPGRDVLVSGTTSYEDLVLSFYPLGGASRIGACDAAIPYTGPRLVDGKAIVGPYAPFNDTRWTLKDGIRIHLPDVGGSLIYEDETYVLPATGVDSSWRIEADRLE